MSSRSNLKRKLKHQKANGFIGLGLHLASKPGYQLKVLPQLVHDEEDRQRKIEEMDLVINHWVVLKGEAIRRKVIGIRADYRLELQGFSALTCPYDVHAVYETAR